MKEADLPPVFPGDTVFVECDSTWDERRWMIISYCSMNSDGSWSLWCFDYDYSIAQESILQIITPAERENLRSDERKRASVFIGSSESKPDLVMASPSSIREMLHKVPYVDNCPKPPSG